MPQSMLVRLADERRAEANGNGKGCTIASEQHKCTLRNRVIYLHPLRFRGRGLKVVFHSERSEQGHDPSRIRFYSLE